MPRIEELEFTKLVSGGKVYRAPCIIYPDKVDGRWWRTDGSRFGPGDFEAVIAAKPEIAILGTGLVNLVSVPEETIARFSAEGIEVEALPSKEAAERYNELFATGRKVIGAFHLM